MVADLRLIKRNEESAEPGKYYSLAKCSDKLRATLLTIQKVALVVTLSLGLYSN